MDIPLKVIIRTDPQSGYRAEVPGLPGLLAEGATVEQLHANLCEALAGSRRPRARRSTAGRGNPPGSSRGTWKSGCPARFVLTAMFRTPRPSQR